VSERRSDLWLLWRQVRYQDLLFRRNPVSAFFTLAFPVLIFVIFSLVFGNERIDYLGITVAQYYAPALAVYAAANATYLNLGITTAYQRDLGILKRVRGTPVPAWLYLAAKMISGAFVALVGVVIMVGLGVVFYGLAVYPQTLPAAFLTLLVGAASFGALGLAIAAVAPSGQGATAIANATLLPLAFFSGIFIAPSESTPRWLVLLGDAFPLKHFNEAFFAAFDPQHTGWAFSWGHLAYVALWGIVGLLFAIRFFRWESPAGGHAGRRRSRRSGASA